MCRTMFVDSSICVMYESLLLETRGHGCVLVMYLDLCAVLVGPVCMFNVIKCSICVQLHAMAFVYTCYG